MISVTNGCKAFVLNIIHMDLAPKYQAAGGWKTMGRMRDSNHGSFLTV